MGAGSSLGGGPWANSRTLWRSRVPSSPRLLPTMSLVNMPWTSTPAALSWLAMKLEP